MCIMWLIESYLLICNTWVSHKRMGRCLERFEVDSRCKWSTTWLNQSILPTEAKPARQVESVIVQGDRNKWFNCSKSRRRQVFPLFYFQNSDIDSNIYHIYILLIIVLDHWYTLAIPLFIFHFDSLFLRFFGFLIHILLVTHGDWYILVFGIYQSIPIVPVAKRWTG